MMVMMTMTWTWTILIVIAINKGVSNEVYNAAGAVWPRPASISHPDGQWFYRLHPQSLQVVFNAEGSHWDMVHEILSQAEQRYAHLIPVAATAKQEREGVPGRCVGVASQIHVFISDPTAVMNLGTREDYVLTVHFKSGLRIVAPTVFGVLRGLETFAQLVEPRAGVARFDRDPYSGRVELVADPGTRFYVECVTIKDAPAYPYRGLMIDTSRHYLPVPIIERLLDAMEANKMNVLHWHVSDDQSFPFQSQLFPKLVEGAWTPEMVYSHSSVRHLAQQALFRGIHLVPEFDSPGHTASFGRGYPHLMAQCPAVADPDQYMVNPTLPETRDLVSKLLTEAIRVFEATELVHLGGDEVDESCLENSDAVKQFMKERNMTNVHSIIEDYHTFLQDYVSNELRRTSIVWQEVFDKGYALHPDTIVDVWEGIDDVARVVRSNHRVVVSGCWYLDHLAEDWKMMYKCDPRDFPGSTYEKSLVIGGHSSMWGEQVDEYNILSRAWPRTSAVAERLWSDSNHTNHMDVDELEDRLHLQRCRLLARGIGASPIRPGVCAFE